MRVGRAVKEWKLSEQGELALEGGKPVEVASANEEESSVDEPADEPADGGYYAVWAGGGDDRDKQSEDPYGQLEDRSR